MAIPPGYYPVNRWWPEELVAAKPKKRSTPQPRLKFHRFVIGGKRRLFVRWES